jgi:putative integral membrane protein (TIGR02587 family)
MIADLARDGDEETQRGGKRRRDEVESGSWRDEMTDFLRAVSGGFIFAIPLIYTLETWAIGAVAELWKLLLFLALAFLIGLALATSRSGGFKEETSRLATIEQAVDVVAVGLIGAGVVLLVLNRIAPGDPLEVVAGKVILLAVPIAIGASVANAIFGPHGERGRQGDEENDQQETSWQAFRADVGATVVGAVILALAIAPTDEIPLLAAELDVAHELALIGLSLLLSYVIVFASGYGTGQHEQPGPFQSPLTETVFAYAVSLLIALASLYLFDRIEPDDPLGHVVSMVLVLGLPASIGGAAGRLVV